MAGRVSPGSSGRSSTPVHVEQAALPHSQPLCGALWPHASGADGEREVVRGLGGGHACRASEAAWLARWARQTETTTYHRVREGTSRRFALVAPGLRLALERRTSQLPLTGRLSRYAAAAASCSRGCSSSPARVPAGPWGGCSAPPPSMAEAGGGKTGTGAAATLARGGGGGGLARKNGCARWPHHRTTR